MRYTYTLVKLMYVYAALIIFEGFLYYYATAFAFSVFFLVYSLESLRIREPFSTLCILNKHSLLHPRPSCFR